MQKSSDETLEQTNQLQETIDKLNKEKSVSLSEHMTPNIQCFDLVAMHLFCHILDLFKEHRSVRQIHLRRA